jgi:hypothetical protein
MWDFLDRNNYIIAMFLGFVGCQYKLKLHTSLPFELPHFNKFDSQMLEITKCLT